ncbi:MAG: hypothetical protein ABIJ16_06905 [Bacteroidota bacterium]
MKRVILFIFMQALIIACFTVKAGAQEPEDKSSYYFGFNLVQTMYGEMVHYGVARVYPDGTVKTTFISRRNFLLQIVGEQQSKANPNKEDLLEKYGVNYLIFNNLWMLRYSEYPYKTDLYDYGWARFPYGPSDAQLSYLKQYGFENIDSFIYGENAFRLWKDMMSLDWVNNYKSLE